MRPLDYAQIAAAVVGVVIAWEVGKAAWRWLQPVAWVCG